MNPLPPQAYTKDTLLQAYAWLMNQNQSIKEMATTPDILVSLYLKATRDGDHALQRPSIQNFKKELKNLAGMMGELDQKSAPLAPPAPSATNSTSVAASTHSQISASTSVAPAGAAINPQAVTVPKTLAKEEAPELKGNAPLHHESTQQSAVQVEGLRLDSRSLQILKETKENFNLSSESEALRMLIAIGHSKSRQLL